MTSISPTDSLRDIALSDLADELASTRRILERVPDEHLGWRPHAKSNTLQGLAAHIAQLPAFALLMVEHTDVDLATRQRGPDPAGREALLAEFDRNAAALRRAVEQSGDDDLRATWTLRFGDRVIASAPRVVMLRRMGISHIVHHRGQLSVYLRLLDVPVPGLYGPSADERGA